MVTFPNAKINIGLDILRRRPDGFHDISTMMVPVGWCDILEIVPSDRSDDTLSVTGRPVDCPPEKNLVVKAVKAVRNHKPFPAVDIFLHKVIPDGAGLGGGSADAAFAIKMVNSLFDLGFDEPSMASIASEIGSDCPFFIYNRPMMCVGTGTTLLPPSFAMPEDTTLVIVKPEVSVPTKAAYAGVTPGQPEETIGSLLESLTIDQWQGKVKNDFEISVFPAYPSIARIKSRLLDMGAIYASMSGSGSAVYGIFRKGDIVTAQLESRFAGCDIFVNNGSL